MSKEISAEDNEGSIFSTASSREGPLVPAARLQAERREHSAKQKAGGERVGGVSLKAT
jgi:hypothetical protein